MKIEFDTEEMVAFALASVVIVFMLICSRGCEMESQRMMYERTLQYGTTNKVEK